MKDVVQFTMSHVDNYGSLLQTYALQTAIEQLGCRCRAICYGAPRRTRLLHRLLYFRRMRAFAAFRRQAIHHTRRYVDFAALQADPPAADVYVTGSDQMFNPAWTQAEPSFFLQFLPQETRSSYRKIAYASSFAVRQIPDDLKSVYAAALSDYDALSLREQSGVALAERLTGRPAALCCDPTLLLTQADWARFAARARRRMRTPYILCYNLNYMVDPYPMANAVERRVQAELDLPIVFLNGSKADLKKPRSRIVKNATPYEFVDLFLNAAFILTSSFHGTAFALQAGKPFIAYHLAETASDSRVCDLLARCGAVNHALPITPQPTLAALETYAVRPDVPAALAAFRTDSRAWLKTALGVA